MPVVRLLRLEGWSLQVLKKEKQVKFNDIMHDLETLGQTPGCVFFSIGAVAFNAEGLGKEFYTLINIGDCIDNGLFKEKSTEDWWAKQSPEARKELIAAEKSKVTLKKALTEYGKFIASVGAPKFIRIHGNGSDFDNAIVAAGCHAIGMPLPWQFWNNRCHRTNKAKGGRSLEPQRQGTYHNALDDAKHQARHAICLHEAGIKVFS